MSKDVLADNEIPQRFFAVFLSINIAGLRHRSTTNILQVPAFSFPQPGADPGAGGHLTARQNISPPLLKCAPRVQITLFAPSICQFCQSWSQAHGQPGSAQSQGSFENPPRSCELSSLSFCPSPELFVGYVLAPHLFWIFASLWCSWVSNSGSRDQWTRIILLMEKKRFGFLSFLREFNAQKSSQLLSALTPSAVLFVLVISTSKSAHTNSVLTKVLGNGHPPNQTLSL